MFNAKETFDAAVATVSNGAFNPSNFSSTITDESALMLACVYAEFTNALEETSMTHREKRAIRDEINPTIEGKTCADDRKTILVLQTSFPYMTNGQVSAINSIVATAAA